MERLSQSINPSTLYPNDLRTLNQQNIPDRADKPIQVEELENWLQSGLPNGSLIWDNYKVNCICDGKSPIVQDLFNIIKRFIYSLSHQNTDQEMTEDIEITICNVLQYSIKEKLVYGPSAAENETNILPNVSSIRFDSNTIPNTLKDILFSFCEELELISRERSNDEGQRSSVATGARLEGETEHPDVLIREGIQRSVLHRMPLPEPIWENPIPEHIPGYLQLAFPFIFLTGDADPYQDRPHDIRQPKSSWEDKLLTYFAKLPEFQNSPAAMFYLNGRNKRIASRKNAVIAISNTGIDRENLPTKEDLLHDREKGDELASKALSLKGEIKDSDAYWLKNKKMAIGSFRYIADIPHYQNHVSMDLSLFQTRACCYNHHPAIHSLLPDPQNIKLKSEDQYLKLRLSNVLNNPSVIQIVHSLMAEMDATILAPIIHESTIYYLRHEWGPNANPHSHKLLVCKSLNEMLQDSQKTF